MRMPTLPNAAPLAGLALRCQSDSRLVRLSREGQTRAFEEIVRRYREPLVSFAGGIVPADRAEDVVQEALAKAHAALAGCEGEVNLKPWLYTIVRNRALNDLRDEPAHEPLEESFDGVTQPPEVAVQSERLAALVTQLQDLPPAQRDALIQRELEGRSHQEIGDTLGVTPGAVRGLIFRARTALRDGAGMLIPVPVLRALLNAGPIGAEAAGTGIGGAAAGLTAGGGGGAAAKAGATLAVAALAIGSGTAIQNRGDNGNDRGAPAFASQGDGGARQGAGSQVGGAGSQSLGSSGHGSGSGSHSGPGGGDDSGHGSGDSGDSSGPGGGDEDGSGGEDRAEDASGEGHEGPGSGEEEHGGEEPEDTSGSGGSGSGSSGSGSGSSGSGSSGSDSSGSDSSGSG
jgi:RNA polymerase sigma factor (sigma-70 family)